MTKKTTGLAAFTNQGRKTEPQEKSNETPSLPARGRGKGETVALTVRLSREDWQRVHQLALSEGLSIQKLAVEGLSRLFEEKGLKRLG